MLAPVPLALALVVLARPRPDDGGPRPEGHPAVANAGAPRGPDRPPVAPPSRRFPRAYWLAWTFLALCMARSRRSWHGPRRWRWSGRGIELADATALGSLFVVGLIVGRVILGTGAGSRVAPTRLLAGMAAMAVAGGLLVWLGAWVVVTGLGLLVAGLGMAGVWATAAGVAVAAAPDLRSSPGLASTSRPGCRC